jgi:predicted adenylyl cyclase CyaB
MPKLIEVELRILLKNRKEAEKILLSRGARIRYSAELKDYWFCPKTAKNFKEASIDKTGFALRIRETKDIYSGKTNSSLECKTLADGKTHSLCHEHEIGLLNAAEMRLILSDIGLKEFLAVEKRRVVYLYKGVKFCFDSIKGVGEGLEIEVNTKRGNETEAHKKLFNLALSLGIRKEEILKKSLTYIAMQKLSRF